MVGLYYNKLLLVGFCYNIILGLLCFKSFGQTTGELKNQAQDFANSFSLRPLSVFGAINTPQAELNPIFSATADTIWFSRQDNITGLLTSFVSIKGKNGQYAPAKPLPAYLTKNKRYIVAGYANNSLYLQAVPAKKQRSKGKPQSTALLVATKTTRGNALQLAEFDTPVPVVFDSLHLPTEGFGQFSIGPNARQIFFSYAADTFGTNTLEKIHIAFIQPNGNYTIPVLLLGLGPDSCYQAAASLVNNGNTLVYMQGCGNTPAGIYMADRVVTKSGNNFAFGSGKLVSAFEACRLQLVPNGISPAFNGYATYLPANLNAESGKARWAWVADAGAGKDLDIMMAEVIPNNAEDVSQQSRVKKQKTLSQSGPVVTKTLITNQKAALQVLQVDTVYFTLGSATLADKNKAFDIIAKVTTLMANDSTINCLLLGYTSNEGSEGYNQNLSLTRASETKSLLLNNLKKAIKRSNLGNYSKQRIGLLDSRFSTEGRGIAISHDMYQPTYHDKTIKTPNTDLKKASDRRVEIWLFK